MLKFWAYFNCWFVIFLNLPPNGLDDMLTSPELGQIAFHIIETLKKYFQYWLWISQAFQETHSLMYKGSHHSIRWAFFPKGPHIYMFWSHNKMKYFRECVTPNSMLLWCSWRVMETWQTDSLTAPSGSFGVK